MEIELKANAHIPWQIKPWDVCVYALFVIHFKTALVIINVS